jgi:hypothetical protein
MAAVFRDAIRSRSGLDRRPLQLPARHMSGDVADKGTDTDITARFLRGFVPLILAPAGMHMAGSTRPLSLSADAWELRTGSRAQTS